MFQANEPDWEGLERNRGLPTGQPVMLQTWHDLIFLHARVPVDALQAMIPKELKVEEFDGSAWLGFVPFRMSRIRHRIGPAAPWLSTFYETNVRTYVTHPELGPGVWFFSLDAARYLACWYARQFFKLPYFHANLNGIVKEGCWQYSGTRKVQQVLPQTAHEEAILHDYMIKVDRAGEWHNAVPETFEFWLVERYRLYSMGANNQLVSARVFHEPYLIANGIANQLVINGLEKQFGNLDFESILLAKTVNVQCFSPAQVSSGQPARAS